MKRMFLSTLAAFVFFMSCSSGSGSAKDEEELLTDQDIETADMSENDADEQSDEAVVTDSDPVSDTDTGQEDDNALIDDDGNENDEDAAPCEDVWTDVSSGLMWENCPGLFQGSWSDSVKYCDELVHGGFDDWRLPTLSELRSLVRGCPDAVTGGACNATDECLNEENCMNHPCSVPSCDYQGGPDDGCYRDPALKGECDYHWSSRESATYNDSAWYVDFMNGVINPTEKSWKELYGRCVRTPETEETDDDAETADEDVFSITLSSPQDGSSHLAGTDVVFSGTTDCFPSTVSFVADTLYPFGNVESSGGDFSYQYKFNTPGADRIVSVKAEGAACSAQVDIKISVQAPFSIENEVKTDGTDSYTIYTANFPTADPSLDFAVIGSSTKKTVSGLASQHSEQAPKAVVNGGYFGTTEIYSYSLGSFGWETVNGNAKGPRACIAYDSVSRKARIEQSMGMDSGGNSLFPDDTDVACAGPQLVKDGVNVSAAQYVAENFETSGISPDSHLPRTAACIKNDGSIVILTAQHETVRYGMTLNELADHLISIGCKDALNLDGGGSTAFWTPDVYIYGEEDRAVFNGLMIY